MSFVPLALPVFPFRPTRISSKAAAALSAHEMVAILLFSHGRKNSSCVRFVQKGLWYNQLGNSASGTIRAHKEQVHACNAGFGVFCAAAAKR